MAGERSQPATTVWTIGHSTRSLDELVDMLRAHQIRQLVDVRAFPRSRRHPQFNRDTLPAALDPAGLHYAHVPALGGRRRPRADSINTGWRNESFRGYADHMQSGEFAGGLSALLAAAAQERVAIMCAEAVPWQCHRSLIADALVARQVRVEHIVDAARTEPHRLREWARLDGSRVTYPGDPWQPELRFRDVAGGAACVDDETPPR